MYQSKWNSWFCPISLITPSLLCHFGGKKKKKQNWEGARDTASFAGGLTASRPHPENNPARNVETNQSVCPDLYLEPRVSSGGCAKCAGWFMFGSRGKTCRMYYGSFQAGCALLVFPPQTLKPGCCFELTHLGNMSLENFFFSSSFWPVGIHETESDHVYKIFSPHKSNFIGSSTFIFHVRLCLHFFWLFRQVKGPLFSCHQTQSVPHSWANIQRL